MLSAALLLALGAQNIEALVLHPPQNSSSTWLNNPMTSLTPVATVDGSSIQGTIMTETINGAPTSATYLPTTFSDYTTLSTSTTITSTTTDSDGNPTPIPIILGPGGVGWVPFIPPGGAPVPPGFVPPPIVPIPGQPGGDPTATATSTSATSSSSTCPGVEPVIPDETLAAPPPATDAPTTTEATPPPSTTPPPPPPTTSEPPPPPPTTTAPPPPPPPPPKDPFRCEYGGLFVLWAYELYGIDGWGGENGDSLHHEVSGCGAITEWHFDQSPDGTYEASFQLPLTMKGGCVERAIVSAGGPSISCSDIL